MRILAVLLIIISLGCSRQTKETVQASASAKPEPTPVEVAAVETRRLDRSILVTGSLLPDETVTVSSEIPGRIARINVDFGQFVRKGDVIAELEHTEAQIAIDRNRAAMTQALARLGLDKADTAPTSTPAMRQAMAQLEDAKFKYESAGKLVKSGDISQDRFNELEKAYRAREAAVEAARDEMRTQWASIAAIQAEMRLMEKRMRDTVIRAPFDGSVSERKVAPGQIIKDNVPLITLVKTHPMRLRLEVPESAAGAMKPGTRLDFTTDATGDTKFAAVLRELNPALNEQSRTLIAEARLTGADSRLRPGMFAQVRLILAKDIEAVVVPKQAIYAVAGLTKVFVVRNGKIVECKVAPGVMVGEWMEVPADQIKLGDKVVVNNLSQLIDGLEVKVKG